jgi:hypothetical protein
MKGRREGSMEVSMETCAKCVLSSKTPDIAFDSAGVCNYCESHQPITYKGEEELLKVLDRFRGGKKYDCMVTLSGGRDSSYVLLKLVRDYGMKVLAVNYENPYTDPQARKNVDKAVSILDVDLVRFDLGNQFHEKSYRHNLKTWIKKPSLGVVPMICLACKSLWWESMKIARKNDIHCIVNGVNRFEDTSYKKALLGISKGESWEGTFTKIFTGVAKELAKNAGYLYPPFLYRMAIAYLFGDPYALGAKLLSRRMYMLDLFTYLEWNDEKTVARLRSELGWDSPAYLNSTWRFDCKIAHLKDLIYLKTLGITEKDDLYAKMVREGLISREAALEKVALENVLPVEIITEVLSDAGVGYQEFLRVLNGITSSSPA